MLKRRAARAGLPAAFSHHWMRTTGITEFLEQDGALEEAQQIANHSDTRTTKLYDRRGRKIKQDEIQRLRIGWGVLLRSISFLIFTFISSTAARWNSS